MSELIPVVDFAITIIGVVSVEPPWEARVQELKKASQINLIAEAKSAQQAEQITSLMKEIKLRVC